MKKKFMFFIIIILILISIIGYFSFKKISSTNTTPQDKNMYITMLGGTTMENNGNVNSCGYIIRNNDNALIVVDGGRDLDSELVMKYINNYGNGKVDYWFITHPHSDHVGALCKLLEEDNNLQIENLCYSLLDEDWYKANDTRGYESESLFLNLLNNSKIKNQYQCSTNFNFTFSNFKIDILRTANPDITYSDNGNDSSMTFKITATDINKSILFLGDSYVYASKELLQSPEKLSADIVQMAHHGQNGVTNEVYEDIKPSIALFNAPKWLYNNETPDGGYNTGKYKSVEMRNLMESLGAKCYPSFNGDLNIICTKDNIEIEENNSVN